MAVPDMPDNLSLYAGKGWDDPDTSEVAQLIRHCGGDQYKLAYMALERGRHLSHLDWHKANKEAGSLWLLVYFLGGAIAVMAIVIAVMAIF